MAKPDDLKEPASLRDYRRKRDFARTPEPAGSTRRPRKSRRPSFVIQKHAARQTHYDFRLEVDGVLKSWAVPRGPSLDPATKRLAVHVEDHPIEYGGFEGVIPRGEYGGGTVMVWDIGTYELIEGNYFKGKLKVYLDGKKLKGEWTLAKSHENAQRPKWFLMKTGAEPIRKNLKEDKSALSGRTMEQIAKNPEREWQSNRADRTTTRRG